MHASTYEYLKPSEEQIETMAKLREAAAIYGKALEEFLPDGPDKTFVIRAHRSNAMWANVAVTRGPIKSDHIKAVEYLMTDPYHREGFWPQDLTVAIN
ncbi:hypothetical protein HFO97_29700 [Rhizobium leguminosarum]|uniref:hypothetical protein n=1 Tax=Rhizobium leguminosarum TaxID=384 RepID=UPI001C9753A8|nr:hypothetical protein [Rhizobium leguminosarum]MBY5364041.1 hypothetical protein [Rhizobium leguminosarum]